MVFSAIATKYKIIIGVAILVVAASIPSVYFYTQYQKAQARVDNPTAAAKEDAKDVVAAIGKLIMLPAGEDPTIATVSDATKLKDQAFFANAQNGDRVLIYSKAKKAILYRASIQKIIEVGPVNISPNATPSAQLSGSAAQPAYTVVLRNGTDIVGLTQKIEDKLKVSDGAVSVTDRGNAVKRDYATSIVIDVKGDKSAVAAQIAKSLGMTVSALPAGEPKPAADFLIILGADQK